MCFHGQHAMKNPEFCTAVQRPDDQIDVAHAALLFARDAYPDLDVQLYLNQLDEWAEDIRSVVATANDPLAPLNEFLFDKLRFIGNTIYYDDPLNSYLNKAIDRRVGLPITLSVIYIDIAQHLNLPVAGIGLPGHFIVRYSHGNDVRYLDPFHQGRLLSYDDCLRLVGELTEGTVVFQPDMLEPVGPHAILVRMLNNLKNAYLHQERFEAALPPVERLLELEPDDPIHTRDFGLLHYQLNHYDQALRALQQYLVLGNAGTDDPVRQIIANIQIHIARLN